MCAFQPTLFDGSAVTFDPGYAGMTRIALDEASWVDYQRGWVAGADVMFAELIANRAWNQRSRMMYTRRVLEPRLTSYWHLGAGEALPPVIEAMRRSLGARYGVELDSIGFNFYRDGEDSVAWHSDRIVAAIAEPIVALVSLGEPRRFLMRKKGGGGRSMPFELGRGDLLVTGGTAQRTWEHAIPKVTHAGLRISLAFRHDMDPRAYSNKRIEPGEPRR